MTLQRGGMVRRLDLGRFELSADVVAVTFAVPRRMGDDRAIPAALAAGDWWLAKERDG